MKNLIHFLQQVIVKTCKRDNIFTGVNKEGRIIFRYDNVSEKLQVFNYNTHKDNSRVVTIHSNPNTEVYRSLKGKELFADEAKSFRCPLKDNSTLLTEEIMNWINEKITELEAK